MKLWIITSLLSGAFSVAFPLVHGQSQDCKNPSMRRRLEALSDRLNLSIAFTVAVPTDQHGTFTTTRYYSANRSYFVQVTPNRHATLYRNRKSLSKIWSRRLLMLPARLLVTDDGTRVAMIDRYDGNKRDPHMIVVTILDQTGEPISKYSLNEVADLSRVVRTISRAHWYRSAKLTPNGKHLVIETVVAKRDPATCRTVNSLEEAEQCSLSVPFEQLWFSMSDGKLTSRMALVKGV